MWGGGRGEVMRSNEGGRKARKRSRGVGQIRKGWGVSLSSREAR
jgi:hypothetical protein